MCHMTTARLNRKLTVLEEISYFEDLASQFLKKKKKKETFPYSGICNSRLQGHESKYKYKVE